MAAKRTMLWLLVWRALRLRFQRVSVVFAALMVGATIVTALSAVWFDINTKMSEELRTFGANFYIGPGHGSSMPQQELQSILDQAPQGLVHGASPWLYGMARTELEKVVMVGVWFESLQKLVPYWQVTEYQPSTRPFTVTMVPASMVARLSLSVEGSERTWTVPSGTRP